MLTTCIDHDTKLPFTLIYEGKYVDHVLVGNWHGFRDCHIKSDLVLIYRIHEIYLQLARISTHNDVF